MVSRIVVKPVESRTHDHVGPVGRGEDDDAIELLDSIHLRQEAHQDAVACRSATLVRASCRRKRVDLVLKQATHVSAVEPESQQI